MENEFAAFILPYYAIYFDFTICNTQIDTAKQIPTDERKAN